VGAAVATEGPPAAGTPGQAQSMVHMGPGGVPTRGMQTQGPQMGPQPIMQPGNMPLQGVIAGVMSAMERMGGQGVGQATVLPNKGYIEAKQGPAGGGKETS